jgi:hypothetical protein
VQQHIILLELTKKKVKSLCLTKHFVTKVYGGVDLYIHVFLTSPLVGSQWLASRSAPLPPGERHLPPPGIKQIGCWLGPRDSINYIEKWKFSKALYITYKTWSSLLFLMLWQLVIHSLDRILNQFYSIHITTLCFLETVNFSQWSSLLYLYCYVHVSSSTSFLTHLVLIELIEVLCTKILINTAGVTKEF